jgi:hypothetical protein
MPNELARAKALMLDLDADTIIAAIEQLAAAKGSTSINKIFWAAADAYQLVPIISLDPQYQLDDWNDNHADVPLTLEDVQAACVEVAEYDWGFQRDVVTNALRDLLEGRAYPPE